MPAIPARQSSYSNQQHKVIRFGRPRGRAMSRQMSGELTAEGALRWIQQKVEQVVGAVGNDVDPPYVYRLNDDSSLFRQAWNIVFSITGLGSSLGSFLAELPDLADRTGVTLSIGPGVDAPLFAAGAGVVTCDSEEETRWIVPASGTEADAAALVLVIAARGEAARRRAWGERDLRFLSDALCGFFEHACK